MRKRIISILLVIVMAFSLMPAFTIEASANSVCAGAGERKLESVATLVNSGILRLNTINDLMAYRYFIAVNNPVVQKLELIPYKPYYNGCFTIFKEWQKTADGMPLKGTPLIRLSDSKL